MPVVSLDDIEAAERVADEKITLNTCIPILDMDARKCAVALKPQTWTARRQFFDNIMADSLEKGVKVGDHVADTSSGSVAGAVGAKPGGEGRLTSCQRLARKVEASQLDNTS